MKNLTYTIFFAIIIQCSISSAFSQNSPENLKTALVYKIANNIVWNATDTSSLFIIGLLSNNLQMIEKFKELSKVVKVDNKPIVLRCFSSVESVQHVHLLYIDQSYNQLFQSILKKISKQNTLLISEEYDQPGEIMINFKLFKNTLTFEYNRANILFQGLDLTDKIVLLKGTEIEIRDLYLQAKKLWDGQKALVESLKVQSEFQNQSLKIQKDSVLLMKSNILENRNRIINQTNIIAQKDSVSNFLNREIKNQQKEILDNRFQIETFLKGRSDNEALITKYQRTIGNQKVLSDSLSNDIIFKQNELRERKKALGERETVIQKQSYWLLIFSIIIVIILVSIFLIFRDYIFIKRAKQKIAEQKEELESTLEILKSTQLQLVKSEKMASLGVLVAGIAHEINNPVNFISSGIEGVEKVIGKTTTILSELNKFTPQSTNQNVIDLLELVKKLKFQNSMEMIPEVIANIKIGVKRTIEITNGLRLYARIDKEDKSKYDIHQIIETALLLLKPRIEKKIDIIKYYSELPLIFVYPGKLSQVFINLLSNAVDSIEERNELIEVQSITITTKEDNGKITIQFSDTGKGIPTEIVDKLFDPFFTTKKVGKGTGLGLSISLGIIEEHQGKISAKNNIPIGAIFEIEIPIKND